MKTQSARWTRIRDLFSQATELPPERRKDFLDQHCADDAEMRGEVGALLDSDASHSLSRLTGAIGSPADTSGEYRKDLLGSIIGSYRLMSVIGRGGAGSVYLGERVDRQYSAKVAIKIVENGSLQAEIGRRFRAERQILANLNHPCIARLLDAGETDQGYPYLVMEYVDGKSIDTYCDEQKLDIEARITLLIKVCEAVRYAHQNLTVHRDIKPANILVGQDGNPKLLDFGIAKLLDTNALAAEMALTRMNDRILTPEYASPEQILGQSVTTATDVYSLAMVLFELLTGLRPYTLVATSQLELERTICITDPIAPSAAIKRALREVSGDSPPTRDIHAIAAARGITPMRLRARLTGDLDAILLRALRKELVYRYSTIDQFVGDLQSYLAREPVNARQGNWVYYSQRFARKHALGVSVAAGFVAMLAGALVVTSIERNKAEREKLASDAVAGFMAEAFAATDPFLMQGKKASARDLLDSATKQIHADLTQQPAVKARLLETMGYTYSRQGEPARGAQLIDEALTMRKQLEGEDNPALASSLIKLGKARINANELAAAEAPLREAIELLERHKTTQTPEYAEAVLRRAELEMQRTNLTTANELYERAIPLYRNAYGPKHPETAMALYSYGSAKLWSSDFAGAERWLREALAIYRVAVPEVHPDRINAESNLGVALMRTGHLDQAASILEASYRAQKQVFGEGSPRLIPCLHRLVDLRRDQEDFAGAEQFAREALGISLAKEGETSRDAALSREKLAGIFWQRGNLREAEQELRTGIDVYRKIQPPDSLFTAASEHFLAEVLLAEQRPADAITELTATLGQLQRLHAAPWRIARSENTMGQALLALGKTSEAQPYLERSFQVLSTTPGVVPDTVRLAHERLKLFYAKTSNQQRLASLQAPQQNQIAKTKH